MLQLKADCVDWRRVEDEIVAIDLRSSTYFTLNSTAADLFALLAEGATSESLIDMLLETYDTTRDQAVTDVDEFLAALESRDLLNRLTD